ncbi:archaellin/type IV pilin N-terminal domain-containing protein [Candidatus Nitrosotenuis uzonensis]|nr:archaellin/type IV pilin N-terminal domain-containing protein [Candidatus Nitrosotenuis uzonensis]
MRRGITPILSVVILIGIALVGSVLLNGLSKDFAGKTFAQIEYKVSNVNLKKDSAGSCYFSLTLHNTGTLPITMTTINATFTNNTKWNPPELVDATTKEPGHTYENTVMFDGHTCGNVTVGNTYVVRILANSADSSFSTSIPVKASRVESV